MSMYTKSNTPGERVQSPDEVVAFALVFLSALQQGCGSVHHVTGQETVLEAKMNAKCLDADVFHTERMERKVSDCI